MVEFAFEPAHVLVVRAEQSGVRVVVACPSGSNFKVEGDRVFQSDTLLVTEITYSTSSFFGFEKESVSRYVEIGGSTYLVEFDLWR